jgi:hypothetical protein
LIQQAKGQKTATEQADLDEKRNVLSRRIKGWLEIQNIYNPALSEHAHTDHTSRPPISTLPESTHLNLPSALTPTLRASYIFGLADTERCLRLAQAYDALDELRRQLRITMGLGHYKMTQVGASQRSSTRARNLIGRFKDKTSRCAERYRAAHSALLSLDPNGDWKNQLRVLKDEDIKGPGKGEDEAEGTRELSWIWRVARLSGVSGVSSREELGPLTDKELVECKSMGFSDSGYFLRHFQVCGVSGPNQKLVQPDGLSTLNCWSKRCVV